jgi:hypothetical protein
MSETCHLELATASWYWSHNSIDDFKRYEFSLPIPYCNCSEYEDAWTIRHLCRCENAGSTIASSIDKLTLGGKHGQKPYTWWSVRRRVSIRQGKPSSHPHILVIYIKRQSYDEGRVWVKFARFQHLTIQCMSHEGEKSLEHIVNTRHSEDNMEVQNPMLTKHIQ